MVDIIRAMQLTQFSYVGHKLSENFKLNLLRQMDTGLSS